MFCVISFGFKCHMVGALTEVLAAEAFLRAMCVNIYCQNLHYGMT